jgi:hypothetical protein
MSQLHVSAAFIQEERILRTRIKSENKITPKSVNEEQAKLMDAHETVRNALFAHNDMRILEVAI